ncbi:hypothetical protein D8674_009812 [Pyrus ussuriensis x Pyrus communis]|uniref:RNase H type-1 domain-containing protein n=1 Tax=Pyrus ussuriensis x Pyrus communis TaxID=2448454 RepID=A0A5N5FCH8_9ROSA|nr:hypothetical protein D8674_009812 [Pyrus ussuriensis x Pyrus communis]
MECDSLQVVQAVGSRFQGSSSMDLLVDDIHASLRAFVDSQVCYVPRIANVAAHGMVKLSFFGLRSLQILEALVDVD